METYSPISFLLLKPDAVASPTITASIDRELEVRGLHLVERVDRQLNVNDVRAMWPQSPPSTRPISAELLRLYMTSGPVRFLILRGDSIVDRCREVRMIIRARYGAGPFCNCLHAPAGEETYEQLRYLSTLLGRPYLRPDRSQGPSGPEVPGVWGRFRALGEPRLSRACQVVWERGSATGWSRIWDGPAGHGDTSLVLIADDRSSMDHAASAIYDLFPAWSPERTLSAAIETDRSGELVLCYERADFCNTAAAKLTELGLTACSRRERVGE